MTTTTQVTPTVQRKESGTKVILKVTTSNIENQMNQARKHNGGKGTQNPPHADVNLWKFFRGATK